MQRSGPLSKKKIFFIFLPKNINLKIFVIFCFSIEIFRFFTFHTVTVTKTHKSLLKFFTSNKIIKFFIFHQMTQKNQSLLPHILE